MLVLLFQIDPVDIHRDHFLGPFPEDFKVSYVQVFNICIPIDWGSVTAVQSKGSMSFPDMLCEFHVHIGGRCVVGEVLTPDLACPFWEESDVDYVGVLLHILIFS